MKNYNNYSYARSTREILKNAAHSRVRTVVKILGVIKTLLKIEWPKALGEHT